MHKPTIIRVQTVQQKSLTILVVMAALVTYLFVYISLAQIIFFKTSITAKLEYTVCLYFVTSVSAPNSTFCCYHQTMLLQGIASL